MSNQDIVEFLVKRPQLLQHGLLEDPQANFLHLPGSLELIESIVEGFTDQGWSEGVVVARGIGDAKFVQPELELQKVAAVLGIRLGHHHPDGQPVLELALVHHRELGAGKAFWGGLQGRFQASRHLVPDDPLPGLDLPRGIHVFIRLLIV